MWWGWNWKGEEFVFGFLYRGFKKGDSRGMRMFLIIMLWLFFFGIVIIFVKSKGKNFLKRLLIYVKNRV